MNISTCYGIIWNCIHFSRWNTKCVDLKKFKSTQIWFKKKMWHTMATINKINNKLHYFIWKFLFMKKWFSNKRTSKRTIVLIAFSKHIGSLYLVWTPLPILSYWYICIYVQAGNFTNFFSHFYHYVWWTITWHACRFIF